VDCEHNLDIVLTAEEHKYVRIEACRCIPALDASKVDRKRIDRWQKSIEMANTMKSLLNIKMVEGTPVKEHCLSMIAILMDCEHNLDIVLTAEEHKYVRIGACRCIPALDASKVDRK
jgi:hypothetical protein